MRHEPVREGEPNVRMTLVIARWRIALFYEQLCDGDEHLRLRCAINRRHIIATCMAFNGDRSDVRKRGRLAIA